MEISQKLKQKIPFLPAVPLLDIYPKELKSSYYSDSGTSMFIAAQLARAKLGKWTVGHPSSVDGQRKRGITHSRVVLTVKGGLNMSYSREVVTPQDPNTMCNKADTLNIIRFVLYENTKYNLKGKIKDR